MNFELSNLELINAKIADFGLAKQMDSEQAHTRTGAIMGTPSYMAPEQAQGRNAEIGPACDVYALGAILYELLTGRPPFKAATTWETVCQVIGQEPVAVRQLQPGTSRDLETICHKCLHKEIGRRYASAQELADDLGRFLAGEPVHARPVRQIERVWRWCRRNPLPAGFAAMTLMAILVAFVLITHSRNEAVGLAHEKERLAESERLAKDHAMTSAAAAARAKDAETNQRQQAEAVVGVLETVFRSVDPRSAGADFKGQLIAQLDAAADQLEKRYAGAPLVRARLRQVLGQTQLSLGEYRKAVTLLERAVAEGRQALGGQDPAVLRTMSDLAHAYQDLGQRDRARRLYEQTLPALKTALGPDHGSTLLAMNGLANLYRETGQSARAIPLYEEILTRAKNKPELGDGFTIGVTGNLAVAYQYTGQVKRAIHLYEETLPKLRSLYGSSNFLVLLIADNLASAYLHGGQWARALPLYEEALRGKRARYGPNHPATLSTMANLAAAYEEAGQLDKARKLLEDTLPRMEARVGPKHMNTLVIRASLANVYLDSGRAQQAVKLFKQALDGMRSRLPPGHPYTLETMANLALAYQDTGELDRADTLLRESLTLWRKRGDDKVGMARTLAMLGDNLLRQRKYPAAEAVLRETIAVFQKETSDSWETFNAQASLGAALLGQRKDKEAEVLLVKAYEGMKQHASEIPPRGRSIPTVTARRLAELYEARGDKIKASQWRARAGATGTPGRTQP